MDPIANDNGTNDRDGIRAWDIVRVDFPYADAARTRRRPALVVAAPAADDRVSILWVLMITSASQGLRPSDVPVSDLPRGGLSHACVVRVSKIATLDARLASRIGELAPPDRVKVAAHVREALNHILPS